MSWEDADFEWHEERVDTGFTSSSWGAPETIQIAGNSWGAPETVPETNKTSSSSKASRRRRNKDKVRSSETQATTQVQKLDATAADFNMPSNGEKREPPASQGQNGHVELAKGLESLKLDSEATNSTKAVKKEKVKEPKQPEKPKEVKESKEPEPTKVPKHKEPKEPKKSKHPKDTLQAHLNLLRGKTTIQRASEITDAPIFTEEVRNYVLENETQEQRTEKPFTQYGLYAGDIGSTPMSDPKWGVESDPRLFFNVAAPSSVFICGSQGSGKSHSLSCLLENALINHDGNMLPNPLTGLVFHYDTFISETSGSPCEAAYLSSNENISVRVLCAPTNIGQIRKIYAKLPRVKIEELRINETDLNTSRMLELMAVSSVQGAMPLYFATVNRILRELRIKQQEENTTFSYAKFKEAIDLQATLTDAQLAPLQQRLDNLESFMVQKQAMGYDLFKNHQSGKNGRMLPKPKQMANDWTPKARQLTIVDLSCPCVTPGLACSLFGICLSLFLEQKSDVGKIVALDEAHKFMTDSVECQTLTESLLATIRLQRHLATRVVISTQEPTISPKLLDLCSVTIVHRFTSPAWLETLKKHLAGAASNSSEHDSSSFEEVSDGMQSGVRPLSRSSSDVARELFSDIVSLQTGEALIFAPSAIIGIRKAKAKGAITVGSWGNDEPSEDNDDKARQPVPIRLAHGVLKVRVRNRVTLDGGRSIMAA